MENFLWICSIITTGLTVIFLSLGVTSFLLGDLFHLKTNKYLFLFALAFGLFAFGLTHEWKDVASENRIKAETKAVYYEVTAETKEIINFYCEGKYPKYSTQQFCKRTIDSNLKYGNEYNGFKPSNVVIKPSGVVPNSFQKGEGKHE